VEHLLCRRDGPVATVTLNRPGRRNALSVALIEDLTACFHDLGAGTQVKVAILAASGAAFCSGHDLAEMTSRTLPEYRGIFDRCTALMEKLQSIPQPVIARVQGIATAAGCQLVAACDLAVASTEATFATPGVKIGLFCTTPMVALTRAIGRKRALEMLLTGAPITASTAAEWGLVNRVVAPAALEEETQCLAEAIAESSSLTVALGKQAFYAQIDLDQARAYAYAQEAMSTNALAADAQEGISAFLEKRPACWQGR
jgi:enoyl-CoA hydratase/carnithine racemase